MEFNLRTAGSFGLNGCRHQYFESLPMMEGLRPSWPRLKRGKKNSHTLRAHFCKTLHFKSVCRAS